MKVVNDNFYSKVQSMMTFTEEQLLLHYDKRWKLKGGD